MDKNILEECVKVFKQYENGLICEDEMYSAWVNIVQQAVLKELMK